MLKQYKLVVKTEFAEVTSDSSYTMSGVLDLIKTYTALFGDADIKEYKIIPVDEK